MIIDLTDNALYGTLALSVAMSLLAINAMLRASRPHPPRGQWRKPIDPSTEAGMRTATSAPTAAPVGDQRRFDGLWHRSPAPYAERTLCGIPVVGVNYTLWPSGMRLPVRKDECPECVRIYNDRNP